MVTATHDRQRDPHVGFDAIEEWGQRSAFGAAKGWPWWAVVVLALGLSIVGAVIDMHLSGDLGKVFEGAYFLGCVAAVCLVRRRNLFGPMVQAPLILAVTIPVVVLLTKGMPSGSGTMSKLITLGVPLVTGFPTMAITTVATVVIGGIRFLVQRKPAGDGVDDDSDDRGGDDRNREERGEARRRPVDRDGERAGTSSRPRPAGETRAQRAGRDDRDGSPERSRTASTRSRSEAPERSGRSAGSRSGQDRDRSDRDPERSQGRDRASSRERSEGRERSESRERGESRDRGDGRERRQAPRTSQSRDRDRGQAPRASRPARDDGRRQPPARRRDDD